MDQENIFVETDPAFNVVLLSLKELKSQERIQRTNFQRVSLKNIESNNEAGRFGGKVKGLAYSAFGRTASAVVRMCMLEAAGVPRRLWPMVGVNTAQRNKAKLKFEVIKPDHKQSVPFCLANHEHTAKFYLSKYDHIYPHFRIEYEVKEVTLNSQVTMPSRMLIFRGSFTEVVEITTEFTITPKGEQQFESSIDVACAVYKSTAESSAKHPDGEFTKLLRKLIKLTSDARDTKMKDVKKEDDLDGLRDDLLPLNLKEENE